MTTTEVFGQHLGGLFVCRPSHVCDSVGFGRAVDVHSEDMIGTYRFIRSKLFQFLASNI